jgi:hypothetical protein
LHYTQKQRAYTILHCWPIPFVTGLVQAAGVLYNFSGTLPCLPPGAGPSPQSEEDATQSLHPPLLALHTQGNLHASSRDTGHFANTDLCVLHSYAPAGVAQAAGVLYNFSSTLSCLSPGAGPSPESDKDANRPLHPQLLALHTLINLHTLFFNAGQILLLQAWHKLLVCCITSAALFHVYRLVLGPALSLMRMPTFGTTSGAQRWSCQPAKTAVSEAALHDMT